MSIVTLYQEYLYIIKQLREIYKLDVDVPHRDIHNFYKDKKPIFKLMYGKYGGSGDGSIVVSFHITMKVVDSIGWFSKIQKINPMVKLAESYVEDHQGETYLGDDAEYIQSVITEREILAHWLDNKTTEEMKTRSQQNVIGRKVDYRKSYDSRFDGEKATMDFDHLKKPGNDEDIH